MAASSCSWKLPQELQIVFEEQPQIIDAVTQHREPVDAGAQGITLPLFAVDARGRQYIGMNHSAAENFQPAGVLADAAARTAAKNALDIRFRGRLREWKIRGTKPHGQRALEEAFEEGV